ncbi:MAG: diacylglycerol kinase family protein, partial [Eubacteriales bacterium]
LLEGGHDIPIGYIPAGTTNDFAATVGLPLTISEAVRGIIGGTPTPIDIGSFGRDAYFSYIASFGAFTKTSYSTPQPMKNALGHLAYLLEGAKEVTSIEEIPMRILSGCTEYCGKFIFGAISNSTSVGGILKYPTESVGLSDGIFEAMFIRRPENLIELSEVLRCIKAHDFTNKNILFFHTDSLELTCAGDGVTAWTTDGEYAGERHSVVITNLHKAIKIIK